MPQQIAQHTPKVTPQTERDILPKPSLQTLTLWPTHPSLTDVSLTEFASTTALQYLVEQK